MKKRPGIFFCLVFCFFLTPFIAHAQGSFSISPTQASVNVTQGNSQTISFNVTVTGGFNSDITALAAAGLAGCATAQFNPQLPVKSPYSNLTLTITTTATCAAQSYTVTIAATSGALAPVTTTVTVVVQSSAGSSPASISDTLKNNFGFGVALGLGWNVMGPDIVNNATIDADGIVRVNARANTTAGLLLETHYYIWPRVSPAMIAGTAPDNRTWGQGPFVAAQPGSAQIISAVGAGWMVGFRRPKGSTPSGFGLGFGYEAIPAAQVLGSEFVNGQKAPLDPSGKPIPIRYETQDKGSVLVVLSVSF